jgi:acetylglutamate synthase
MSDTPRCANVHWYGVAGTATCEVTFAQQLEIELNAVTAERDTLLSVVNTLADKRWFLDNVGAECTFEGLPMVQIGHLEDLVEMAENALRGKEAS